MSPQSLRQSKILVTGGAGFLGAHVAQALAAAGARLVLQASAHKRPDLLGPVFQHGSVDLVIGSLAELDRSPALLGHLAEVDYVVHLDLQVPTVGGGEPRREDYVAANLPPLERLLARLPAGLKGLCLTSVLAVYGGPCAQPVSETEPTQPRHALAEMKLVLEDQVRAYGERASVPVTVLRLANLYGPGELHSPRAVPSFIRNLLAAQPAVIYGDGSDVYDYLYVADAARAVRLALEHLPEAAGTYNIGSGQGWTTRAVAETIQRQLGLALPPKHMPARGPRHALIANFNRAAAQLGYRPSTALEVGLAAEIEYFRAHLMGPASIALPDAAHGLLMRPNAQPAGH